MKKRMPAWLFLLIAGSVTLLGALVLLMKISKGLGLEEVVRAIGGGLGMLEVHTGEGKLQPHQVPQNHVSIVFDIRMPRILVALLAGMSLAAAGTVMQAVFRNPLASPEIMGTAAGSALGAVFAIWLGLATVDAIYLPTFAFLGAIGVSSIVYLAASGRGGVTVTGILLAGMAMNSLAGAGTAFVVSSAFSSWERSTEIMHWLIGGLDKATWQSVWIMATGLGAFSLVLLPFLRDMDLLTLQEESAESLGVRVRILRQVLLVVACGLTATAVSSTGGIVFVGLVVPHMARLMVGPSHRGLLPCAAIAGALLLVVSDMVCQIVLSDEELRIGIVTAGLGAPFFLLLLARHRRGYAL